MASQSPDQSRGNGRMPVGTWITGPKEPSAEQNIHHIPKILPHERVFPIQIGGELFKLSGASLSSDAPSYFSQYFLCQLDNAKENDEDPGSAIKTLYIDRDPATFRDIALHLQGYHVKPKDGTHFVRLFADSQFYSLPKLISQLYDESIFVSIGQREFQIPRDLLTEPSNSPNYFSLGFTTFFTTRSNQKLFPGLDREGLIRPPSILPPAVPKRDADTFAELLQMLQGYPVHVRDDVHRQKLLRDARYFHFKGLEQRLIPHSITYNQIRGNSEIALRLENVQKSGVSVSRVRQAEEGISGWVDYSRPLVEDEPAELVLEIAGENTKIHFTDGPRAEFFNDTSTRVAKLFGVIATKLDLSSTSSPLGLFAADGGEASSQLLSPRVSFEPESAIILDGKEFTYDHISHVTSADSPDTIGSRKRRRGPDGGVLLASDGNSETWTVRTGQWRLRIQPVEEGKSDVECVLVAVKIDAVTSELARSMSRGFLSG